MLPQGELVLNAISDPRSATVAWFDDRKGFGSVDLPDGTKAFVHRSVLPGQGYRTLVKGEPVKVRTEPVAGKDPKVVELVAPAGRHNGVVEHFDFAKGFGFIADVSDPSERVFVHYSDVLTPSGRAELIAGEAVEFFVKQTEKGRQAVYVKRLDPRSPWDRFATFDDSWGKLADLAEDEQWSYKAPDDAESDELGHDTAVLAPSFPILANYIRYTFAKLFEDNQVTYGTKGGAAFAAFNTGLVTDNQEDIYGLFIAKDPSDDGSSWRFISWVKESDNRVSGVFDPRPQMAKYWDDPAALFYDPRKRIVLDRDHFIRDNIDRYPPEYRKSPQQALAFTMAAKDAAERRVQRNYKTAIPQYHRGEIQLLLPLSLDGSGQAQLALVVKRHVNETTGELVEYTGETVLPLRTAMNNARLLARPDRDWLNP